MPTKSMRVPPPTLGIMHRYAVRFMASRGMNHDQLFMDLVVVRATSLTELVERLTDNGGMVLDDSVHWQGPVTWLPYHAVTAITKLKD